MSECVMPVPDQVRDDGSGIQNILKSRDYGFRRNDAKNVIFNAIKINARLRLISHATLASQNINYSIFSRVASPVVDLAGLNPWGSKKTSKYTAGCGINESLWP